MLNKVILFSGIDRDAALWRSAVYANSGSVSSTTFRAVNRFVKSAKSKGYWSKINRINLICGDQLAAALVPLKVGGGNATDTNTGPFVAGDYTEATGLTGNGTSKYLKTGLIPSASLVLSDTHIALYNRAGASGGNGLKVGCSDVSSNLFELFAPNGNTLTCFSDQYVVAAGGRISAASTAPFGFLVGTRTAAAAHALYQNAGSIASSTTPSAGGLAVVEMYVCGVNANGVLSAPSTHPIAAYSVGSGLSASDVTNYNADIQAFQTALGRNV